MGGLIPLLLPSSAGTRSSVVFKPMEVKRPASAMATHSPVVLGHQRQQSLPVAKAMKRLSIAPTPLPVLPYTSAEWMKAIIEVKRKYASRKYRTCSTRCCEILDNLKDTSNVETLYLVYLHFYAASSFEMCARPLSQSSTYRTKLLSDAREHYDCATVLIQKAEETITQQTRSASSCSTSSSLDSPSISISSQASATSSALSSPRTSMSSVLSVEDMKTTAWPGKPKKKKKVSFLGLPEPIEVHKNTWQSEPHIRPDSPTLGWEEDHSLFGPYALPPEPAMAAPTPIEPFPDSVGTVNLESSINSMEHHPSSTLKPLPAEDKNPDFFDLESFLRTRTRNRFASQLSALRSQVVWHRGAIDTLLAQPDEIPETPSVPDMPHFPALPGLSHSPAPSTTDPEELYPLTPPASATTSPHTLGSALSRRLKDTFGNSSSFDLNLQRSFDTTTESAPLFEPWDRSRSGSACSTISRPPSAASTRHGGGDEALQKRIERLRATGWQRKRFDSRRYEALREQVLGELVA